MYTNQSVIIIIIIIIMVVNISKNIECWSINVGQPNFSS